MSWRQYQEEAAAFFRQLGMNAEVDKRQMQGVRGTHDVDVWVTFSRMGFEHKWVVECKEWKNRVPKGEIQKLRTIVDHLGADKGIFLAENGYQSGAYEAARNTSLLLTSLKELRERGQAGFFEEWGKEVALHLNRVRSRTSRERRKLQLINPRQVMPEQVQALQGLADMLEQLDFLGEGLEAGQKGDFPAYLGYQLIMTHDVGLGLRLESPEGPPILDKQSMTFEDLMSVLSYCDMVLEQYEQRLQRFS